MNDALQQLALDLAAVHPLDLQVAIGRLRFLYGYHYGRIGADESEAEIATEMLVARVIDEVDALRQANNGVQQNGISKPVTQKTFRARLSRLGFGAKKKENGNFIVGLGIQKIYE